MNLENLPRRILSLLTDLTSVFFIVVLFRLLTSTRLSSSPLTLIGWSILLTPGLIYVQVRLFGRSFGHWLTGLRRLLRATDKRPQRIYDYLFESKLNALPEDSLPVALQALAAVALVVLASGLVFYSAAKDPLLRATKVRSIALFAPSGAAAGDWRVMPWYYASGAWPVKFDSNPVLYALPYEKAPPHRFVGKIQSYWGKSGARVTLIGPLTLRSLGNRMALRDCFTSMFGCTGVRREVFERPLAPYRALAEPTLVQWITVENPLLNDEERPEGLYLLGRAKNGEIIEAYFLVNSLMRFQGFILQRFDNEEGRKASLALQNAIGSFRMSAGIEASRAWVNQSLSKMDIRSEVGEAKLRDAQGLLLSKISVDPTSMEPFYFLAGTSFLLFKNATRAGDVEAAAAARSMINSSYRFAQDVAPQDPKMKEMESFKSRVENF